MSFNTSTNGLLVFKKKFEEHSGMNFTLLRMDRDVLQNRRFEKTCKTLRKISALESCLSEDAGLDTFTKKDLYSSCLPGKFSKLFRAGSDVVCFWYLITYLFDQT